VSEPERRPMTIRSTTFLAVALLGAAGCAEPEPEIPPRQLSESAFHYPEELWDAGIEGETVLEIHVSDGGSVDSAHVEQTSGYAAFDSAAVVGARDLLFEPARRGDESVAVRVLLPVQFHLPTTDSTAAPAAAEPQ
jgi:TonB family protein